MKYTKVLLPLKEGECIVDFHQTTITIYSKHLVNMGLGEDISFHKFLTNMFLNEETYILALKCTLQKSIVFLNAIQMIYEQMYLEYILDHYGKQTQMCNSF